MAIAESFPERGDWETRTFRLPITQREVGVTSGRDRTHPVFQYHIKPGEWRKIGNLEVSSGDPCLETNSVELTFRDSHSGVHQICIDEIRLVEDILLIGTRGSAALREIKHDGIVMLQMSMSRDIPVDLSSLKDQGSFFE
ncbi:hypothetical protein A3A60_02355 [Candidatus Curtissbacteria bacterium RIFCSPLOWO2_01_FULL_42_26]|uniref:Uncharacterized protein n=1 Tax=Candidatus Curtissbacteria bacterium RIFCSPLOWO2_01_FULL_42_26 TaxID=1797729 RepID=A0A1F5I308_9BACT|nr:MAG: hypothetical protein A3A60_02355 [Candidatus Curtissbacteria bacterium RIFCSPLOWO2_01_FULL_42_26]